MTSFHGENGKGGISDAVAAAGRWELVVCQELAVESKLTFKASLSSYGIERDGNEMERNVRTATASHSAAASTFSFFVHVGIYAYVMYLYTAFSSLTCCFYFVSSSTCRLPYDGNTDGASDAPPCYPQTLSPVCFHVVL